MKRAVLGLTTSVAVMAALACAPAFAQMDTREGIALQNQILELRRDMQALRDQTARGAPPPGAADRFSAPGAGRFSSPLGPPWAGAAAAI